MFKVELLIHPEELFLMLQYGSTSPNNDLDSRMINLNGILSMYRIGQVKMQAA